MKVLKAVLPLAGLRARMLSATKSTPKEVLALVDRPLIQHIVNEAVQADIKEIVLLSHASKNSIENISGIEFEAKLEARLKRTVLEKVRLITSKGVSIISIRQPARLGLWHAILETHAIIGRNPFAILLPDVIVGEYKPNLEVNNYGEVDFDDKTIKAAENATIIHILEKPIYGDIPSKKGRYAVSPAIWNLLETTPRDLGDEIQSTKGLLQLRHVERIEAYYLTGKSHHCDSQFWLHAC